MNTTTRDRKTIEHITPIDSKNTETTKAIGISKVTETMVTVTTIQYTRIDKTIDGKTNVIRQVKGDRMAIEEGIEAMGIEQGVTLMDLHHKVREILRKIKIGQIVLLGIE